MVLLGTRFGVRLALLGTRFGVRLALLGTRFGVRLALLGTRFGIRHALLDTRFGILLRSDLLIIATVGGIASMALRVPPSSGWPGGHH